MDDLFSFESEAKLRADGKNETSVVPRPAKLRIPTVELDRKALSATVTGIFSLIFFPIFPIAILAIVKGALSRKAPNRKKSAVCGIVLGVLSLLLFAAAVTSAFLFRDVLLEFSEDVWAYICEAFKWAK